MPHYYDLDGVQHKLFVLRHLTFGSKEFCAAAQVHRLNESDSWYYYLGHLKSIVSETTIEAAIKLRMVHDFIRADGQEVDLDRLDKEALGEELIGEFRKGTGALSLRDSCNKIIHATDARLCWADEVSGTTSIEYWTGGYYLSGSKGSEAWEVELFVGKWCADDSFH
jgi:hypothetical protein